MTERSSFGHVTIDPVRLAEFMRSPNGPVFRDLLRRGDRVKDRARELVGVSTRSDGRRGRKPGTLRDSIVKRIAEVDGKPAVIVGTDDPIALWHHEGTEPHVILPRAAGGRLVFYWPRAGAIVSFPRVNHPGTKPNRFLVNALPAARD